MPIGSRHRLENPGKIDLELIEVQTGSYLGEDDIVRIDGRLSPLVRRSPDAAVDHAKKPWMPSGPGMLPASLTLAERYRRDGRLADADEICRSVLGALQELV